MRLDDLSVELRPRTPWEAVELGTALVRRHARAIWRPWLALSLPVFVAINALAWWLDKLWLAALVMWWLKPVFDRIPLYVISRAVFGPAPDARETRRAMRNWGLRPMLGYLSWRRLSPVRSLHLPIDLLEGGPNVAQRRQVIGGGVRGTAALVTLVCANFEIVLVFATYALALMFVPVELMSESMRAAWDLISQEPPRWVQLLGNLLTWSVTSVIEPFYVGAGFGLYLDRRTRIEAWDVEIAFRRLRARLRGAGVAVLVAVGMLMAPGFSRACTPARQPAVAAAQSAEAGAGTDAEANGQCLASAVGAAEAAASDAEDAADRSFDGMPDLPEIFERTENDPRFSDAVARTENDPLLHPKETITEWVPRKPGEAAHQDASPLLQRIAAVIAAIAKYSLWILLVLLLIVLILSRRTWLPWLRDLAPARRRAVPAPIEQEPQPEEQPLPADVMAHARGLWTDGKPRAALALLYRASVASMTERTGALLVPGATESQCLRAARALGDAQDRAAFARMVNVWQYAAYAERLPATDEFESLLVQLGQRFGWTA
ncbi:DUF4129 domain-containing protein [Thermomonas sp.]|uniref:DUF4129 domain-containing protein n=1 Tax=Thermomonas sp. TaxID=1971895 RepID=UPI002615F5F6|nr:DUF4129 domain-containing protein [Thermomonas sp.]